MGNYIFEDGDILKSLTKYNIKNLEMQNRIVMAPMCMYSSDESGMVKEFHKVHYGSKALGKVGLIIMEATAVIPNGRISSGDLGIWSDDHIKGLKSVVDFVHTTDSKIGIQLAHAGRKSESNDEYIVAPSAIRHSEEYKEPRELSKEDIKSLIDLFTDAAIRSDKAGFDTIEIHAAHGYLIHEFLSPITNKRTDEYGGNTENRSRFLKEILQSVRTIWPSEKPIFMRVSADDYEEEGIDKEEMVKIINEVKEYIDIVHVSTGGLIDVKFPVYPGYQVLHAEAIREKCNIPTIAVGLIDTYEQIEDILGNERADLVAMGRALLKDPNFVMNMAHKNNLELEYTRQYKRGY